MKRILLLITFISSTLYGSPYCLDNSEHLEKAYDDKEWHSVECYCPCNIIKGSRCLECGHLQNARTYKIAQSTDANTKNLESFKFATSDTPQDVLRKLAAQYLLNNKN